MATIRMPKGNHLGIHLEEARALLDRADFFPNGARVPSDWTSTGTEFRFLSPVSTPWADNNIVHGRLYCCNEDGNWTRPAVVLLHGWNDELGHRFRLPALARRLNRMGLNAVTLELPYHFHRRPGQNGAVRNFFSRDVLRSVEAVRQTLADLGGVRSWLETQGCIRAGLWGVSLGGWLGGLFLCHDARIDSAVLITPAARPDRMMEKLPFCAPIRGVLEGMPSKMKHFNLAAHRPKTDKNRVLLVEAEHDCFVPKDTMEELWDCWGQPEIWRLPHGHISVLSSAAVAKKGIQWLADRLKRGLN